MSTIANYSPDILLDHIRLSSLNEEDKIVLANVIRDHVLLLNMSSKKFKEKDENPNYLLGVNWRRDEKGLNKFVERSMDGLAKRPIEDPYRISDCNLLSISRFNCPDTNCNVTFWEEEGKDGKCPKCEKYTGVYCDIFNMRVTYEDWEKFIAS